MAHNTGAKGEFCGEGTSWGCKKRLNIHVAPVDEGVLVLNTRPPARSQSPHVVFHEDCAPWEILRPAERSAMSAN